MAQNISRASSSLLVTNLTISSIDTGAALTFGKKRSKRWQDKQDLLTSKSLDSERQSLFSASLKTVANLVMCT